MGKFTFVAGMGIGAGLVYFLDRDTGAERRQRVRERWDSWAVAGQVPRPAGARIAARRHPGRRRDDLPAFDFREERTEGSDFPTTGVVLGVAGGALAVYGLARRGKVGKVMRSAGVGLLSRGLERVDVAGLTGLRERRRAIDFQKSLEIDAPIQRVFAFWRDYENFPLFLGNVREVEDLGNGRSHWTVEGPAGVPVEWEAELTELEPNRVLAWRSEPGAVVPNRGEVRFTPSNGGTRVELRICYSPPAGELGEAVAELLGDDPRTQMNHDLNRVKTLLEAPDGDSRSRV